MHRVRLSDDNKFPFEPDGGDINTALGRDFVRSSRRNLSVFGDERFLEAGAARRGHADPFRPDLRAPSPSKIEFKNNIRKLAVGDLIGDLG